MRHINQRAGNVAVLTALLMTSLIGLVGFAIEGGMMMAERRRLQTAADSAAMAAAVALYNAYPSNSPNPKNTAANAARDMIAANGIGSGSWSMNASSADLYSGGNTSGTLQVRFDTAISSPVYGSSAPSPTYGEGSLNSGCVEVVVTSQQKRYFTQVWGGSETTLSARALAKGAWVAPKDGVIVLGEGKSALKAAGNGTMTVTGGDIVVNSTDSQAVTIGGSAGAGISTDKSMYITGSTSDGSKITADGIFTGQHPTPDPYAYLPTPSLASPHPLNSTYQSVKVKDGGWITYHIITPGKITSSSSLPKTFTNNDVVIFNGAGVTNPVFWFERDFNSSGAEFVGMATGQSAGSISTTNTNGILIYNHSGAIKLSGGTSSAGKWVPGHADNMPGQPDVKPLGGHESGIYQGLSYWQPSTNTNDIDIVGQADWGINGTVYAPNAKLDMSGQGTATGAQFVVKYMEFTGNAGLTVNYNSGSAAKTRVLRLLE